MILRRSSGSSLTQIDYQYAGQREPLSITFFAASISDSPVHSLAFEQVAWVLPRELGDYDFLAANRRLVAELATGRIKPSEVLAAVARDALPDSH